MYNRLKVAALVYLVVFIALVRSVDHLWWLWPALTAFLSNLVVGYLFVGVNRRPKEVPSVEGQTLASSFRKS